MKSTFSPTLAKANCSLCSARDLGLCRPLTDSEVGLLAGIKGHSQAFAPGSALYRQGDLSTNYFILLDGWVALSIGLEDGKRHIVDFGLPGAFLGGRLARDGVTPHSAECITLVRVCTIPRCDLDELIACESRLAARLFQLTACHESRAHDHLVNLSCRNARGRIAHLLLELFHRATHRLPTAPGDNIPFPLTLDHIGDTTGLTGVHVSRTLRVLREQGITNISHRRLTILDPDALIRAAGFDEPIIDYDLIPDPAPRSNNSEALVRTA